MIYARLISKRERVNAYGKLGFNWYIEYVDTDDISKYNKGKHHKFSPTGEYMMKAYQHIKNNNIDLCKDKVKCFLYRRGY